MNANEIVRALYLCAAGGQTELQTAEWCTKAADLIETLQAELADYHHMSKLVDGKMGENQRLRRINENLQERLAASQRREKAAVEDMTKLATKPITPCHSCSKTCLFPASLAPELQPATWCRDWQWRGEQREGKGEHHEAD